MFTFNETFIKACQEEFERALQWDLMKPILTEAESQEVLDFGIAYLMGPLHLNDF